jgi:hypothetical protein
MNLPLQIGAVSRGPLQKSRSVSSAGRVFPSWMFICDSPNIACSCPDNSVACCDSTDTCNCDGPKGSQAGCTPERHRPRVPGNHHYRATGECPEHHEALHCAAGEFTCYDDAQGTVGTCD